MKKTIIILSALVLLSSCSTPKYKYNLHLIRKDLKGASHYFISADDTIKYYYQGQKDTTYIVIHPFKYKP